MARRLFIDQNNQIAMTQISIIQILIQIV
jgi:hypothetical protein